MADRAACAALREGLPAGWLGGGVDSVGRLALLMLAGRDIFEGAAFRTVCGESTATRFEVMRFAFGVVVTAVSF